MSAVTQRVLVTGATGGIGQAVARAFSAQGADLVLSGRRADVLEALAGELGAQAVVADLGDRDALDRLVTQAGEIDVLVANAALPGSGRLVTLSQAQVDITLEVNLRAPVALARALLPSMIARDSGHIVFISSLAGKAASPAASLYNATKFGLRGFALGVREDLHGKGVSASVILPGFISDAGMFHDSGVTLPRGVGTRTPEQVAGAVLRAVAEDRAEIVVAPPGLRLGSELAGIAPAFSAWAQRLLGSRAMGERFASGQAAKRPDTGE
jgi:short-subunit dehydrogenase